MRRGEWAVTHRDNRRTCCLGARLMARRNTRKRANSQSRWHYRLYWVKSKDRVSLQDHSGKRKGQRAFGLLLSANPR